jgi:hypothetical protein
LAKAAVRVLARARSEEDIKAMQDEIEGEFGGGKAA